MAKKLAQIGAYYEHIDAGDTDSVLMLFSPDAVYERADATYRGAKAMREFFCVRRLIKGTHKVERIWLVDSATVLVLGRFDGVGAEGDQRSVGFADIWHFSDGDQVDHRRTFLALGHDYIQA